MKKIIIAILVLNITLFSIIFYIIKPNPEYYPKDDGSFKTKYLYAGNYEIYCSKCGKRTTIYKIDNKKRVICDDCFRKIRDK